MSKPNFSPPVGFAAHQSPDRGQRDRSVASPAVSLSVLEQGKLVPSGESIAHWC